MYFSIHYFVNRVAYVTRCQDRNLDKYMEECWSKSGTGSAGVSSSDNSIQRVAEITSTTAKSKTTAAQSPMTMTTTTTSTTESPETGNLEIQPSSDKIDFVPSARVPLPHFVFTRSSGGVTYKSLPASPKRIPPQVILPNFLLKTGASAATFASSPIMGSGGQLKVVRQGSFSPLGPSLTFYQ